MGYSLFGCGANCLGGILSAFITMYLTDNLLLSTTFIAEMMLFARITNAISEALFGIVIDNTKSKKGNARFWLILNALPCALPVFLLFNTPIGLSETGKQIWVTVTYLLHVSVFGAIASIAFSTLLVKMTRDPNTRTKLTNMSNLMGQVAGLIVGAYAMPMLMYFGGFKKGYLGMSAVFTGLGFLGMLATGLICKEDPDILEEAQKHMEHKIPVSQQVGFVLKNKYSIPLFLMYALYNFAGVVFGSMALYFFRDVLGDPLYMTQVTYAKLVPGIIVCVLGIVPLANRKLGKQKALVLGAVFQVIGFFFVSLSTLPTVMVGNGFYGVGMAFYAALMGATIGDVADYVNAKNNTDIAGTVSSIAYAGMRIGMMLGSVGVTVCLNLGKYDAEAANLGQAQSAATLTAEKWGYAIVPLICSIILVAISFLMDADRKAAELNGNK